MDILNLSLGGGYQGNNDLLAIGLDNAVDAGVVVAVAAGNSGPGQGTLESPGRARKIITVGGSTNQHFVGQPFTYPAGGGTTVGAAVGDFDRYLRFVRSIRHSFRRLRQRRSRRLRQAGDH